MTSLLAVPFRLNPGTGFVQGVEEGSDQHYAELLSVLIQTKPGERTLVPGFGVTDPAFYRIDRTEVIAAADKYGPPVRIKSVATTAVTQGQQDVVLEFDRKNNLQPIYQEVALLP